MLPFPIGHDGAFWLFYWWDGRPGARSSADRIVPAKGLDPVEVALTVTGSAWNGLPVAARALAAWTRIAAHHDRLLAAHTARPLAAAVNRLVACRAGGRPSLRRQASSACRNRMCARPTVPSAPRWPSAPASPDS